MSFSCSSITNILKTGVAGAVSLGQRAGAQCGRAIGFITPKIADIAAKLNSYVPARLAGFVNALKSDYGVAGLLVAAAIGVYAASSKSASRFVRVLGVVAALGAITLSAVVLTKPFGAVKA